MGGVAKRSSMTFFSDNASHYSHRVRIVLAEKGVTARYLDTDILLELRRIAEMSRQFDLRCANVFHAGDGNLHPLILYAANRPGELEKAEAYGGAILELCVAAGGTITGEHGVGVEKINQMCVQFAEPELRQFHAVKAVFDPHALLNPGKAVPT